MVRLNDVVFSANHNAISFSWILSFYGSFFLFLPFQLKALYTFAAYVTYITFRRQHLDLIQKELGR